MARFKPKVGQPVSVRREPKIGADPTAYYDKRPVWRVGQMQMSEPDSCGWNLVNGPTALDVQAKLAEFERLTWKEILVAQRHRNHPISISDISPSAQKSLQKTTFRYADEVVSLRLSGPVRVFGVMENEVFHVLWWDPDHKVCPAAKK